MVLFIMCRDHLNPKQFRGSSVSVISRILPDTYMMEIGAVLGHGCFF